jgi:hypothetical protein
MLDILWLPQSAFLAKVSPNATTGHTYTLTSEETKLTADRSEIGQNEITLIFFLKVFKENLLV